MENTLLSPKQTNEYIKKIKDLELCCYEQNLLQDNLKRRLLYAEKDLLKCEEHLKELPKKPEEPMSIESKRNFTIKGAIISFILGCSIVIIHGDVFWTLIVGIMFLGFFLVATLASNRGIKYNYSQELDEYNNRLRQWEIEEDIRKSVVNKQQKYVEYIKKLIHQSYKKQSETKNVLKKFYDLEYVYPKYQGIVPICTIYEYLESGRCYSLAGPDGAYNLYEQELLMKTIIGKLDDVIDRLDDIADNQRMLANEIRRSHSELSIMLTSLDNSAKNMSESLAISEYYNRVNATNTAYLAWVDFLSR